MGYLYPRLVAFVPGQFEFARLNFLRLIFSNMSSKRYGFRSHTLVQQLPPHTPQGSPRDPTPRIRLNIENLDLTKSYVRTLVPPRRPARVKKDRPWTKWTGAMPLTDPTKLPAGWHMNEDDLEIE